MARTIKDPKDGFKLSPTSLNLFLDCPRCFWLAKVRKINPPKGVFPGMPGGVDTVLKSHFAKHRAAGTVPQFVLDAIPNAKLGDVGMSLVAEIPNRPGWTVGGIMDDCLIVSGKYCPFDHKTKRDGKFKGVHRAHSFQVSTYGWILEKQGKPISDRGYLANYFPVEDPRGGYCNFDSSIVWVAYDFELVEQAIEGAIETVLAERAPKPTEDCEYCQYAEKAGAILQAEELVK